MERGEVRSKKWGKLTDDDLTAINGQREQLEARLQQHYGSEVRDPLLRPDAPVQTERCFERKGLRHQLRSAKSTFPRTTRGRRILATGDAMLWRRRQLPSLRVLESHVRKADSDPQRWPVRSSHSWRGTQSDAVGYSLNTARAIEPLTEKVSSDHSAEITELGGRQLSRDKQVCHVRMDLSLSCCCSS